MISVYDLFDLFEIHHENPPTSLPDMFVLSGEHTISFVHIFIQAAAAGGQAQ